MSRPARLPLTDPARPDDEPDVSDELDPEWQGRRSWTARWRAAGVGGSLITGVTLLAGYFVVAVVAILHFGVGQLGYLPRTLAWETTLSPEGPDWTHPFGIMKGPGVDVLSALVRSTPTDLAIVFTILGGGAVVGLLLGSYAGWRERSAADTVITTAADLLVSVPPFLLVAVVFLNVQPYIPYVEWEQLAGFVAVFVLVLWPFHARPVRSRARQVANEPYVEAARAAGASTPRILVRHILPNTISPILAQLPADFSNLFFFLTVFPFLNCFGSPETGNGLFPPVSPFAAPVPPGGSVSLVPPLAPEWGLLFAQGVCNGWSVLGVLNFWWMYLFPMMSFVGLGFAIALLCDGISQRYERRARGI
ncbi:MAG: ABC transporter permease [Thermoplasmata archaeon]|nr:ABC transporter permease [Thermoplasmata archaeon]